MTVFTDRELSAHDAEPIECFEFVGTHETYRYTSGQDQVTVAGKLFIPIAMKRSKVKVSTQSDDRFNVEVEMASSERVARDYAFQITPPDLTLIIYRVHRGTDLANDWAIYWSGPVVAVTTKEGRSTFQVPSMLGGAMSSNVPSVYYQTPCNHVLFDGLCKLSRVAYLVATTVTQVEGTAVTLASNGGKPDGFFKGGEVLNPATGERRMIVSHGGPSVVLNVPFSRLNVGDGVEVTAGCDHAFNGDCKNRFNNQLNFGGHPFIPANNMFEKGF